MSERFIKVLAFEDKRGAIIKLDEFGVKFNIVTSKKGTFRAGDVHPNMQHDFIISGSVRLTYRPHVGETETTISECQYIAIAPGLPHLFEFLEDTVMLEWWDSEFSAEYYPPYRKIVEESMK